MNNNAQTGKDGEQRAAEYLMGKGYKLVERNYRYKRSEIDIIVKKEQLLVFVEVKTRSYSSFGYPEDAVNGIKIKKVIEGADQYVHEKNWCHDIRFDVISIDCSTQEIVHFEDAFY
ncbi:YraN family protein [Fulvivirga kasyanovii]|uniref:UPF0102 protein E1163_24330 n=1 Tax=Fulvivirga kasyanovii TaxID=396812 RepID=A0ABW9RWM0_9BACT|nr:YraN family protein [Fulvivirga kasyanovii]MTI28106.1 YraN family protein [Fulvivirga kasyanovii]